MILVFGSINLDLIFALHELPAAGETMLTRAVRIEPGGKGANQALAAARDGAEIAMVGAVGRDSLAPSALSLLRTSGIDLSRVITVESTTGCAGIFVDRDGRNVIGVGSGANLAVSATQVEDDVLSAGTTVALQMEVPAAESAALIRRARARGARVVLNLAPAGPIAADALRAVHALVVNEIEAGWLGGRFGTGPHATDLHRALGMTVIQTLGAQGVEAASASGLIRLPALPITPVDTTGAGDCFTGVLAASLDRGADLEAALRRAVTAAGLCCMRAGSQATMPSAAEIDAALSS